MRSFRMLLLFCAAALATSGLLQKRRAPEANYIESEEGHTNTSSFRLQRASRNRPSTYITDPSTCITDPSIVGTPDDLLDIQSINLMNLASYIGAVTDRTVEGAKKGLEFLARYGFIINSRRCDTCQNLMSLSVDKNITHDKHIWRCNSCPKSTKKEAKKTVRSNSYFANRNLTVQQILFMAADWIENPGKPIEDTVKQFEASKQTVLKLQEDFRQMTEQWFLRESQRHLLLGGPGTIVEIDETLVVRAKSNRSRNLRRKQTWVLGMIERESKKVLMFRVPRRNAATLLPIIEKYVLPGTTIISDSWAAYNGTSNLQAGFAHGVGNQKYNFVDSNDTQSIEAPWNAIKSQLRNRFGTPEGRLGGHMFNYMWRRFYNRKKLLNRLLIEMNSFRRGGLNNCNSDSDDSDSSDSAGVAGSQDGSRDIVQKASDSKDGKQREGKPKPKSKVGKSASTSTKKTTKSRDRSASKTSESGTLRGAATGEGTRRATETSKVAATGDGTRRATETSKVAATGDGTRRATGTSKGAATGDGTRRATETSKVAATGDGTRRATETSKVAATGDGTRRATGTSKGAATGEGTRRGTGTSKGAATGEGTRRATGTSKVAATGEGTRRATGTSKGAATGDGTRRATGTSKGAAAKRIFKKINI